MAKFNLELFIIFTILDSWYFTKSIKMFLAFFDKESQHKKKDADGAAENQEKATEKDVEKLIEKLSEKEE